MVSCAHCLWALCALIVAMAPSFQCRYSQLKAPSTLASGIWLFENFLSEKQLNHIQGLAPASDSCEMVPVRCQCKVARKNAAVPFGELWILVFGSETVGEHGQGYARRSKVQADPVDGRRCLRTAASLL